MLRQHCDEFRKLNNNNITCNVEELENDILKITIKDLSINIKKGWQFSNVQCTRSITKIVEYSDKIYYVANLDLSTITYTPNEKLMILNNSYNYIVDILNNSIKKYIQQNCNNCKKIYIYKYNFGHTPQCVPYIDYYYKKDIKKCYECNILN